MSLKRYTHLCAEVLLQPWALDPSMLAIVATILSERVAGVERDERAIEAALLARKNDTPQPVRGGVAVIPMYGVLASRMNLLSESSGGTSFERLTRSVRLAAARSDVATIVIDCDSPGGTCAGAPEFAATLRDVRASKPIVFQVNHLSASAAYWAACNATKIHCSPSGSVGSIGVFSVHRDLTGAFDQLGIKHTFISAGKYKLEGMDGPPLTDDALAQRQQQCARMYERFVADVAKGRGVPLATVRSGYGEGRCVDADTALAAGMVDKIATLDETIERLLPAGASLVELEARSGDDTAQEPPAATAQDRRADRHWQTRLEGALLELSL